MCKCTGKSGITVCFSFRLLSTLIAAFILLLFIQSYSLGKNDVPRLCESKENIYFAVDHPKNMRVCASLPLNITIANINEEKPVLLEKVLVSASLSGRTDTVLINRELPLMGKEIDEFCLECMDKQECCDMEACGERYADIRSNIVDLSMTVNLAALSRKGSMEGTCAGEEIMIEAQLVIGGKRVMLQKKLGIRRHDESLPSSATLTEERDIISILGPLPHPPGWYAGDQHSHTSYEKDAGFCIWEWPDDMSQMISAALSMDLNWQFFTDHSFGIDATIWNNAYNECMNYNNQHPDGSYRCLYGEEVSTGERSNQFDISHLLALPKNSDNLGYYADGCSWLCNNCNAEQIVIDAINSSGGMSFIAHPYDSDFSWFDWNVTGYRGIEVLNSADGSWDSADELSFDEWNSRIRTGDRKVGIADSDAHYIEQVGYSFTYCHMPQLDTNLIRSAIADGKCVFGNGPLVFFEIEEKKIGETLASCPGTKHLNIDAYSGDSSMGYLDTLTLFLNGQYYGEIQVPSGQNEYHTTTDIVLDDADSSLYLHVVNYGAVGKTYKAYTNPMWLDINNGFDNDFDSYTCQNDCNDNDDSVYPGAPEINDGIDNQCLDDPGYGIVDEIEGDSGFNNPADKTEYSWQAQPNAAAYEVARSPSKDFSQDCAMFATSTTYIHDSEMPSAGSTFYYLVRANAPNVGSWGKRSSGEERIVSCP